MMTVEPHNSIWRQADPFIMATINIREKSLKNIRMDGNSLFPWIPMGKSQCFGICNAAVVDCRRAERTFAEGDQIVFLKNSHSHALEVKNETTGKEIQGRSEGRSEEVSTERRTENEGSQAAKREREREYEPERGGMEMGCKGEFV